MKTNINLKEAKIIYATSKYQTIGFTYDVHDKLFELVMHFDSKEYGLSTFRNPTFPRRFKTFEALIESAHSVGFCTDGFKTITVHKLGPSNHAKLSNNNSAKSTTTLPVVVKS